MRSISVDEAWKYLAALGAGTGAVYMLRWFWWRISAWTEIIAMFSSVAYFAAYPHVIEYLAPTDSLWVTSPDFRMFGVALATIATWLIGTYLTPPDQTEHLLAFYQKVRPAGPGWGPIAKLAPDVQPAGRLGAQILAALFGSGIVYCSLPGMGALIFGRYTQAALCAGGAIICGIAVALLMKRIATPAK